MKPRRILIADDVAVNAKLLDGILTSIGHETLIAASGAEALELVEKERPDLLLLDVVMPEMTGYEVCARIRQNPETRLLPIVMISALDATEERTKAFDAGADDFLEKPIHKKEFLARVRSLLRIKELTEQLAQLNETLEERVKTQVAELDRLGRLKRFFSPELAKLLVSSDEPEILASHRRRITVAFIDLRLDG